MDLSIFNTANLYDAATDLFSHLGIKLNSSTKTALSAKDILKSHYKDNGTFALIDKTYYIGTIEDSVFKATEMFDINYSYKEAIEQGDKKYNGLMLFALELNKQPNRTEISELTRAFNRISQKMPVALVLKYTVAKEAVISIAISERFKYLQNWRHGEKAGKVIILRDIHTLETHAGHTRILLDLQKHTATNYEELHKYWLEVLDVNILNKKFFLELSAWYFSAMEKVSFPDDMEKNSDVRNATNLIRLITRVIFIWFIKEKKLVSPRLFEPEFIVGILKDFNKNEKSHNYYNAILQNLFFGTLNQRMDERKFAKEGDIKTNKEEYGVKNLFRYADLFTIPENEVLALFKDVPFLNGGLFDCLDKPNDDGKIEYIDGFSRNARKKAKVPDYIFFGEETEVDLNDVYGTKNKRYSSRGLINLLNSYKFTVAENTPIEEEIALDPELLGKVFENLLASYNPETQTTARKQTGSFYTPREIVNYMVDESLIEYLKQKLIDEPEEQLDLGNKQVDMFGNKARKGQLKIEQSTKPSVWKGKEEELDKQLRQLLSYEPEQPFTSIGHVQAITEALNNCKILDPACGSGAFPMGILHKMVHILQKLDPENKYWKDLQRKKAIEETETAFKIGDKEERAKRLAEINDVFENNASDYGRKLYLIENCIYGIDIQPIAVQIAKLRFFISLVIDQKVNKFKENFGVRSLPNLETKFVAANTLIGLDKPQQTLLRNPNIEVKENELKELRHKYFTANTRKEKIALQKQDKKLRLEIAKMLENDGWETKVAKQIVAFDPYDQNQSSGWFDPEWMFGMTSGFDIVIGNPPYINISNLKPDEYRILLRSKFRSAKNKSDTYAFFVEMGFPLLKSNGVLSYIIPQTWKATDSFSKLREIIFKEHSLTQVVDLDFGTFDAIVKPMVVIINNQRNIKRPIKVFNEQFVNISSIEVDEILVDSALTLNTTSNSVQKLLFKRIEENTVRLENIIQFSRGIKTSDDGRFILNSQRNKDCRPVFRGKNIRRYQLNWEGEYVWYRPDLMKEKVGSVSYTKAFFEVPEKLVTQRVNSSMQLICAWDDEQKYFLDTTNLSKYETWDKKTPLKYICAILNSRVINYWYCNKYLMPTIGIYELHSIPIKLTSTKNQTTIINLTDKIIQLKQNKRDADTSKLEKQIDELVYELYDLNEEEIKIIEGS